MIALLVRLFGGKRKNDKVSLAKEEAKYSRHDVNIENLRVAKGEVRTIRRAISSPTGNWIEDMITGEG